MAKQEIRLTINESLEILTAAINLNSTLTAIATQVVAAKGQVHVKHLQKEIEKHVNDYKAIVDALVAKKLKGVKING